MKDQPKWCPLQQGRYKINLDKAVFSAQNIVGVGMLIRDEEGRVIGACSRKIMAPLEAVEAEAKAFEFGLQFAKDMLIHDIVLKVIHW